ncbi:MAG: glycosyltransferase family 2 protein, partial [Leptospiraceae bacterium]|nr:glycosyltransferase family 2 protein [Leptospiraceae bacterium]
MSAWQNVFILQRFIVLPFKNAASTLAESLDSICKQTEPSFVAYLINDHSSDDSLSMAQNLADNDSRFVVLQNDGHGIVDALNTGLARCRDGIVFRMDADDRMHPQRLARQTDHLQSVDISSST